MSRDSKRDARRETPSEAPGDAHAAGPMGDILEFMRLLWAVDHGLAAKSKRMETTLGVTGPQRLVVRIVGHHPGISAGRLAAILHLHPSTLTGILRRLETRAFLERQPDPVDARRSLFELTDAGRALNGTQMGTVEAVVTKALKHVPSRKLDAAREVLVALANELAADDED